MRGWGDIAHTLFGVEVGIKYYFIHNNNRYLNIPVKIIVGIENVNLLHLSPWSTFNVFRWYTVEMGKDSGVDLAIHFNFSKNNTLPRRYTSNKGPSKVIYGDISTTFTHSPKDDCKSPVIRFSSLKTLPSIILLPHDLSLSHTHT